jgi:sialic acid synthase SpsE
MVAARDLAVDTIITSEDIEFKRPGTGLEPWRMDELIGRTLVQEVAKDAILEFRMLK